MWMEGIEEVSGFSVQEFAFMVAFLTSAASVAEQTAASRIMCRISKGSCLNTEH